MNANPILVTGATGKTGMPVVRLLRERGLPVRAFVHRLDQRSEELKALGAEVVVGDFLDLASVRAAIKGVKRVYFCYPPGDGLLEATTHFAVAARDEGVEAVVNMSQITVREEAKSPLTHQHWLAEQVLDWACVGASHIRPTFFSEDLYLFTGGSIGREGKMCLPFGEGKHAPVSAEDIARVVVGILADPEPHLGKRYVLTGPHDMKVAEMAGTVGKVLGKPVEYVNVPIETWRVTLVEKFGFPEYLGRHLAAVARDHQEGVLSAETDAVEKIGGKPPESLEEFVGAHRDAF